MIVVLHLLCTIPRTERKEFSNDPIHEMKKISAVFQTNVTNIESDIARLKKDAEMAGQVKSFYIFYV